jgi:hypothetical protein
MSVDTRFDGVLASIAGAHASLPLLLQTFFSFLHRKTDMYVVDDNPARAIGFATGVAERMVRKSVRRGKTFVAHLNTCHIKLHAGSLHLPLAAVQEGKWISYTCRSFQRVWHTCEGDTQGRYPSEVKHGCCEHTHSGQVNCQKL